MENTLVHFAWTPEMSVGEGTIDAQHQRLLGQLNAVIDAMMYGSGSSEVASALEFFKQYVNEHLAYEEEYMTTRGYSDTEEHKKKHDDFRERYRLFHESLTSGAASDSVLLEIEAYLGNWWTGHILHEDKKYYIALGPSKE